MPSGSGLSGRSPFVGPGRAQHARQHAPVSDRDRSGDVAAETSLTTGAFGFFGGQPDRPAPNAFRPRASAAAGVWRPRAIHAAAAPALATPLREPEHGRHLAGVASGLGAHCATIKVNTRSRVSPRVCCAVPARAATSTSWLWARSTKRSGGASAGDQADVMGEGHPATAINRPGEMAAAHRPDERCRSVTRGCQRTSKSSTKVRCPSGYELQLLGIDTTRRPFGAAARRLSARLATRVLPRSRSARSPNRWGYATAPGIPDPPALDTAATTSGSG